MSTKEEIRQLAEQDFITFCKLVNPMYRYGQVHYDFMNFLANTDGEKSYDDLGLLPRGHLKSHIIASWVAWELTKDPTHTVLYVSGTEDLAILQLDCIKNILISDVYKRYWPDMVNSEEGKRKEWASKNIKLDHPLRAKAGIRDRSVAARSVGSNTTGLHCSILVFDDIVVPQNAYTEEGRQKVKASYSQFSSVANTGCITKVVGTRYHGKDIYQMMIDTVVEVFDDDGNIIDEKPLYRIFQRQVEEEGVFIWPREQCPVTKKWYGFNNKELAKIRSKYLSAGERAQYYAQYYNNPNDPENQRVDDSRFQYYDRRYISANNGDVFFNGKQLNLFCAGDLAFTTGTASDYTAFAVIGVDGDGFIYILDLDQFKTNKYSVYYEKLYKLWDKWKFKKARIETNAGANLVVKYIQDEFRKDGIPLVIEGKPSRGEKVERIQAILEPRYETQSIWHYRGGLTSVYEEQLILERPSHDDLKDAVSAAVEISRPANNRSSQLVKRGAEIYTHERFGGRLR